MFISSGFNIEMFYISIFVTTFDQLKFKLVARIKRLWKLLINFSCYCSYFGIMEQTGSDKALKQLCFKSHNK